MMTGKPRNYIRELADAMYGPGNWFYDLESCPTPNSEKETYRRQFEEALPPTISLPLGTIIICGTGSDAEMGDNSVLFYQQSFTTKPQQMEHFNEFIAKLDELSGSLSRKDYKTLLENLEADITPRLEALDEDEPEEESENED